MKTVLFLVSGNGGTLKFLNEAIKKDSLPLKIVSVIADRDCNALKYAKSSSINSHLLKIKKDNQDNLKQLILSANPDIVITNIHKILHANVINLENINFINLHYSLLPAYAGLIGMDTILKAKKDKARFIGATAHSVIEEVDKGEILGQCITTTDWAVYSENDYYSSIFKGGCLILLNQLIKLTNKNSNVIRCEKYESLTFNPSLIFDPKKFDFSFWTAITKL